MAETSEATSIAYFKKLGGTVTIDEQSPGKPVIGLVLYGTNITDDRLVSLNGLTELQELILLKTRVTDDGLVHLKGLTRLRKLNLRSSKVTDAGLIHLKGLTSLQFLWLNRTKVTRVGIEKLQKALPNGDITWDGK